MDTIVGNKVKLNDGSLYPIDRLQKIKKVESLPISNVEKDDTLQKYKGALKLNREHIYDTFAEAKEQAFKEKPVEEPQIRRSSRVKKPIDRLKFKKII